MVGKKTNTSGSAEENHTELSTWKTPGTSSAFGKTSEAKYHNQQGPSNISKVSK